MYIHVWSQGKNSLSLCFHMDRSDRKTFEGTVLFLLVRISPTQLKFSLTNILPATEQASSAFILVTEQGFILATVMERISHLK